MVQRASEGKQHKEYTKYEVQLSIAMQDANIRYLTQKIICLGCGEQFGGTSNKCPSCDRDFYQQLGFAKPDILIPIAKRGIVLRVNGAVHEEPKQEAYDIRQKGMLESFGYIVADVTNRNVQKYYKG